MGDVINLRMARKARKRAAAKDIAAAKRAQHGRSKAERKVTDMETARRDRIVDGARLGDSDPEKRQD